MFKVICKEKPVYKSLFKRDQVTGLKKVWYVISPEGEETWWANMEITAKMFAESMQRDLDEGNEDHRYEMSLHNFLSGERIAEEDKYLQGHTEASDMARHQQ